MEIARHVWETVEAEIINTGHGTVTLIIQDGKLIQVDKTEKIRITPDYKGKAKPRTTEVMPRKTNLQARIMQALADLRFGQVIIVIKDYNVTQIERLEKHRVGDLEGLFGEGI